MDQPINVRLQTIPAFIGRALRGPLDIPVLVDSLAAYARRFGGVWQRSSMSLAVEQFFAHGGQQLYVVRVANNAYGATLSVPCAEGTLLLSAVEPGSTEVLRAAVDYDGIADDEHFNLIVQRLSPQNGLIIDQEIYSGVSCNTDSAASIVDALQDSSIVEVNRPVPACWPLATMGKTADSRNPYILPSDRGGDGGDLCDYDLIGSAVRGTGLFSLGAVEHIDLLYVPPPTADGEPGPAAILAAELYARKRGAMLILDPKAAWQDAHDAAAGVRQAGFTSCNILAYFPRIRVAERSVPAGGALAGLLCKLDANDGPWSELSGRQFAFNRRIQADVAVSLPEQRVLHRAGINVIAAGEGGRLQMTGNLTLGSGSQSDRQFASLSIRRLCLFIGKTIESATRWAIFDADRGHAVQRVRYQVEEYLHALASAGAFAD